MNDYDVALEEFKTLVAIGRDFFGFYLRAFVLLFAVLGVVFKLFLDALPGSMERAALVYVGEFLSLSAGLGTLAVERQYLAIAQRCDAVTAKLGIPNVYFLGPIRTARLFPVWILVEIT
jgi:hypothetical protein